MAISVAGILGDYFVAYLSPSLRSGSGLRLTLAMTSGDKGVDRVASGEVRVIINLNLQAILTKI